jgi:plastocyanin
LPAFAALVFVSLTAASLTPAFAADTPASIIDDPLCGTFSGSCFDPDIVSIVAGDTVTWTNLSTNMFGHSATSDDPMGWDTGILASGASATITFPTAGTFPYHCSIHPDMLGTVDVAPAPIHAYSAALFR